MDPAEGVGDSRYERVLDEPGFDGAGRDRVHTEQDVECGDEGW